MSGGYGRSVKVIVDGAQVHRLSAAQFDLLLDDLDQVRRAMDRSGRREEAEALGAPEEARFGSACRFLFVWPDLALGACPNGCAYEARMRRGWWEHRLWGEDGSPLGREVVRDGGPGMVRVVEQAEGQPWPNRQ